MREKPKKSMTSLIPIIFSYIIVYTILMESHQRYQTPQKGSNPNYAEDQLGHLKSAPKSGLGEVGPAEEIHLQCVWAAFKLVFRKFGIWARWARGFCVKGGFCIRGSDCIKVWLRKPLRLDFGTSVFKDGVHGPSGRCR